MVCHLAINHQIVVRVCIEKWIVEVHDSLIHTFDDMASSNHWTIQLLQISRLFLRLLYLVNYLQQHPTLKRRTYEMQIRFLKADKQYRQMDEVSCGSFVCMYLDRLLTDKAPRTHNVDQAFIASWRRRIARRIFLLFNL